MLYTYIFAYPLHVLVVAASIQRRPTIVLQTRRSGGEGEGEGESESEGESEDKGEGEGEDEGRGRG